LAVPLSVFDDLDQTMKPEPRSIGTLISRPAGTAPDFPVIPVEPGIFSIVPDKCRFGSENVEVNQALASQFP